LTSLNNKLQIPIPTPSEFTQGHLFSELGKGFDLSDFSRSLSTVSRSRVFVEGRKSFALGSYSNKQVIAQIYSSAGKSSLFQLTLGIW
jgi:hypothetical protein